MDSDSRSKLPWSFWAISAVTLIWNLAGAVNFFAQMNPEILDAYRESEQFLVRGRPEWATGTFAVAVLVGTLGSVLLLFRRPLAVTLFIISFVGVVGTTVYSFSAGVDFSFGEVMGIILMPLVVACFLIWYSKYAIHQGWLDR